LGKRKGCHGKKEDDRKQTAKAICKIREEWGKGWRAHIEKKERGNGSGGRPFYIRCEGRGNNIFDSSPLRGRVKLKKKIGLKVAEEPEPPS